MKKIVLTSLILALNATMAMASNSMNTPKQELRKQVMELLDSPNIEFKSELIEAKITFTLNRKREIVILSIDTENSALDSYIKRKLNYKKVLLNDIAVGNKFTVNFKIEKVDI
ncbi:hypothetical protein GGR42_001232 [Saonia flava]|uniref:Uncharacterized protein n=1 Tax=Saonia flava TaxID=523696 RepID=A0A846QUZ9_9FLAO|nr:hypothetical protein [Saonia flava]NJB70770.1 hypothetical protein [Saonia flava]